MAKGLRLMPEAYAPLGLAFKHQLGESSLNGAKAPFCVT